MNIARTFDKTERLCSIKIISGLFDTGDVFHNTLFKVVWSYSPALIPFPAQVAFSVSKRSFRHAVTRNIIKRRMREAYRNNKHILYEHLRSNSLQIVLVIIFRGGRIPAYEAVEKSVMATFEELIRLTGKK